MGTLTYDSFFTAEFEDRLLEHIQIVIATKLRRNESFFLSWHSDIVDGDRRESIWLSNNIPLRFAYTLPRQAPINGRWVEELMLLANSAAGLRPCEEPSEEGARRELIRR